MSSRKTHSTALELSPDVPPEIDCGVTLTLGIRVTCPSGCNLSGPVRINAADREIATVELATPVDAEELVVAAPSEVGDHTWMVAFRPVEIDGIVHAGSACELRFRTRPHTTSMTIWGAPTPVVAGSPFELKLGVKCAAGCRLAGQTVQVHDEAGVLLSQGKLGEAPWPETRGLYAAELSLVAPSREEVFRWHGSFGGEGLRLPHTGASARFRFLTAQPPEHTVVVELTEGEAGAPLEGVAVFLGVYQGTTDARGRAELRLPKGTYSLVVRKRRCEAPPLKVDVDADQTIAVQARLVPDSDPEEEEVWM